ncbi:MmcQ/YjbR family DNA-binding protein [Alistipes sp. OttesenSCG-928-B03]|nr:MmcQ/YjbR family DNA-binding protein [Alistipes sp. OttesenSCG-928-B03]
MDIERFRECCLAVKGAAESLPFLHHNVLVFKIMNKMFCMLALEPSDGEFRADLKCDPERSVALREQYEGVGPGHVPTTLLWNRIKLESDLPDALIEELIAHAVDEVVKKLPRAKREEYRAME